MELPPNTALDIPENIRAFVYLVGMVGFPVVVTVFVLWRLQDKLKAVDERLVELGMKINERPLGIERTTDFVIYLVESLQHELLSGLRLYIVRNIATECTPVNKEEMSRVLTMMRRDFSSYFRPIFRKHQRYSARFPTVGGNLSSLFVLTAPSQNISAGETEARLVGQTHKDPAEALLAVTLNNVHQFGSPLILKLANEEKQKQMANVPPQLLAMLGHNAETQTETIDTDSGPVPEKIDVIDKEKLTRLTADAIQTVCTILRDSMLEQIRANSTDPLTGDGN